MSSAGHGPSMASPYNGGVVRFIVWAIYIMYLFIWHLWSIFSTYLIQDNNMEYAHSFVTFFIYHGHMGLPLYPEGCMLPFCPCIIYGHTLFNLFLVFQNSRSFLVPCFLGGTLRCMTMKRMSEPSLTQVISMKNLDRYDWRSLKFP